MKDMFRNILGDKAVIIGVGNPLRGDDGFGPAFIQRIAPFTKVLCIDGGSAPENYLGKISKEDPEAVLIVDAAHLGLEPGEYRIFKKENIAGAGFSTHDISPALFIEYLEKSTRADIYMLGVQPENVDFGAEMSGSVRKTLDELAKETIRLSSQITNRK